jgi:antirestriction protein ArdC
VNAAFCCASLGIVPTVRHTVYIGSWLEVLREDNRAIVRAASQASKAADYVLGFLPQDRPFRSWQSDCDPAKRGVTPR